MKLTYRLPARCLAMALLLLGSCMKNKESPTPTATSLTVQADSQLLEQTFLEKKYGSLLFFPLKNNAKIYFSPRWDHSFQGPTPETVGDIYTPLELHELELVGVRKYLVGSRTNNKLSFSEATYFFKEKEQVAKAPDSPLDFFTTFTGTVVRRNLTTGQCARLLYKNGVEQKSSNQSKRSCITIVTCYWTGICRLSNSQNIVFGTSTSGIDSCDAPPDDGVGCSDISWVRTGSDYQVTCDGGTGGTGGTGGGGSGTGGGGGTDPPATPCQELNNLGAAPAFSLAANTLAAQTGRNYETGFTFTGTGRNPSDYTAIAGDPNTGRVPFPPTRMNGLMHTHPPGAVSVFSTADLAAMWRLYNGGNMENFETFTITVFTDSGDDYVLQITDLLQFYAFGQEWLVDDSSEYAFFLRFYSETAPDGYGILKGQSAANNERNFLRLLRDKNTGLTMSKHDRNTNTWQQLGLDANNSPTNIPCP